MNTKGTKFLAVLAVLAMAFAGVAVFTSADENDAGGPIASNVATEEELATALTTAVKNPGLEYVLTVTEGFPITADTTIGSNVTLEIASGQTLAVNASKTLTNKGIIEVLAGGLMTINGTVVNDGTITNNGGVDNWVAANVTLNGTAKITTSGAAKGTINGTNEPLVYINGGTLENQTIDATGYTTGEDRDQPVYVYQAAATVINNNFKLVSGSSYGLAISAIADKKVVVTGNTFDANGGAIRKAVYLASNSANISVELTGNNFTGVKYDFTEGKDADLVLEASNASCAFSIGSAGSGANVIIDNSVRSIATAGGADDVYTLKGTLTFENLNIRSAAFLDVAEAASITVTDDVVIIGTLDNDGTINVPSAYIATKITDGVVKVSASEGSSEKTVTTSNATTTEAIDAAFEDGAEALVLTGAVTESVTVPANKAVVITNGNGLDAADVITAKADGAQATIKTTAATSFKVDVGFDKPIEVTGFNGIATITKGSIVINGEDTGLTEGTFNLHNGDVAKVSGFIGNVTFQMADDEAAASAKVIVDAGEDKKLTILDGTTMLIKAKINVEINGEVVGQDIADSVIDVSAAKSVVINDGAVLKTVKIKNDEKDVTVYSGSDINKANFTGFGAIVGKDAASGEWMLSGTTLILNNYNGTYNFEAFAATLTKLELAGTNAISYVFGEDFVDADIKMFGNATITSITTSTSGSLDINVDLSSIDKAQLFKTGTLTVISAGALNINGVDVSITVSGQNGAWTADDTKAAKIVGISSGALDAYNANFVLDAFSAYTSENVIAISSAAATLDNAKTIDIKSAGTAINATGAVIISNARTVVSIDGKKAGIDAGANAVQFKSSTSADVDVKGGLTAGAFTVMETEVTIAGTSSVASITESNTSSISFIGKVTVTGAISITQGSSLALKDAVLGGAMDNGGIVSITGNAIVFGSIDNKAILTNDGKIGLYGTFDNKGVFTNNGTFTVLGKEVNTEADNNAITFTDAAATAGKVKITAINLKTLVANVDGSYDVSATVTLGPDTAIKDTTFKGTLTPSQVTDGYVMTLANQTASITVTYAVVPGGVDQVGSNFTVSVSGYVVVAADDSTMYLDTYTVKTTSPAVDGAGVTHAILLAKIQPSAAAFTTSGKVISTGPFTIYSPATATIAGEFEGDIVANITDELNINGKFTGNITSNGAAAVSVTKKMVGDITAAGNVSSTLDLTGDIVSGGNVTISGKFTGDVTMETAEKTFSVMGTATGTLTFTAEYKATKDATTKTASTATVDFVTAATTGAVQILTVAGADATAETEMKEVSLKFGAIAALGAGKTASIKVTSGIFGVPESKALVTGYELVVEAGATIEVAKAAQLDVTASALKVSKDAVKNFEVGTAPAVTYGKVLSIMSFDIDGGAYTIYSNVAYALSNCDENADINVLVSDTISEGVNVKKGVNVIVGDGVTLTFAGMNVEMESDAKITVVGTGRIVLAASQDDEALVDADEEITYYSFSGKIVYGDNAVEFDGVRFTAESTVVGVAATETVPAKISTTLLYNEGTATIAAGVGTGSITLGNSNHDLIKGDDESNVLVSATFIVAEGAVFDAVAVNDAFGSVIYDDDLEIGEYTAYPTTVEINGILNLSANTTANGVWSGLGKVTLPENKTFTLAAYDAPAPAPAVCTAAPVATFTLVDTTEDENGYAMALATADNAAALTFTAKKVKLDGEDTYVMTVGGHFGFGAIEATVAAVLDTLTIQEDAAIAAETTYLLKDKNSVAIGYLMTKEIYMKAEGVTAYGALDYQVTFENEGYTVYTYFASVDFEEITDITIEKDGFVFDDGQVIEGDVTITIMDGVFAQVHAGGKLIIGEAATTLGAGAPVIVGSIWIPEDSYMIVYPNADITGAEILSQDKTTAATTSKFDIEGTLYATAYASKTAATTKTLANAAADLVPEITGYTFTSWKPYNDGNMGQLIGVCDVTATLVAQKVIVKATFLEGVQYYCNGVLYDAVGIDNKVTVGSIFTAKIVDYSKYQGTPLVNGQNAFEVTEDVTLNVTGVSPVEPTPEPEPAGMTLTEILLIVLVVLIAIMVVIIALRLNRS